MGIPDNYKVLFLQGGASQQFAMIPMNLANKNKKCDIVITGQWAKKAAQDAMNGWDPTGGAIYYFNPDTATNKWIWSRTFIKQIGKHRFCK